MSGITLAGTDTIAPKSDTDPDVPVAEAAVGRLPTAAPAQRSRSSRGVGRGRLLFECDVTSGARAHRLQVFERTVAYGTNEWRFEEIDAIAYEINRYRAGLSPLSTIYEFHLVIGARTERVKLTASMLSSRSSQEDIDLLFHALVSVLHDRVGSLRLREYLARLSAGERVRIGSMELHRSGIRIGRGPFARELGWDRVAGAEFVHGRVMVHRFADRARSVRTKPCGSVSMTDPNAVLLPDLLPMAADRFGRTPNLMRRNARLAELATRYGPLPAAG